MISQIRDDLAGNKRKLLLTGFGVGLSWASVILDSDHIVCPELVEYKD
jgi:3-oxoacyl-[acyl-carrier-protein] synthase III